jgi:hypothetical protein
MMSLESVVGNAGLDGSRCPFRAGRESATSPSIVTMSVATRTKRGTTEAHRQAQPDPSMRTSSV